MDYRLSDTFVGGVVPTSLSLLQRGVAPIALCSLLSWLFHVSYLRFFVSQAYMPFTFRLAYMLVSLFALFSTFLFRACSCLARAAVDCSA